MTDSDGSNQSPVFDKIICIDPGHGGTAETDHFRVGPSGEREEWINLRVAYILTEMLAERGARVVMTRTEDVAVGLKERADLAMAENADLFISIHHNATADRTVNFPIIYFHANATENEASVEFGSALGRAINDALFNGLAPVSVVSDHTIFPSRGAAVLRHSYGIPGVIGEASFFSNPEEEIRLKNPDYNLIEAEAYLAAIEEFFSSPIEPIKEKYSTVQVPPFEVAQEAERMKPEALLWLKDFEQAGELAAKGDVVSLEQALKLFTRSARFFPDSPVARECHIGRSGVLGQLGREEQAAIAALRVQEFYPE